MYNVWHQFSLEVRNRVAQEDFSINGHVNMENCCPLGFAFREAKELGELEVALGREGLPSIPVCSTALSYLTRLTTTDNSYWVTIHKDTLEFILDWDNGKIENLAEAVGAKF